jgi:peptide/nickel transport system substrate-binding protein
MKKKNILATSLAVTLLLSSVLTGCASNPEQPAAPTAKEEVPKQESLIVARKADAGNLDPHFITSNPTSNYIYGKVYEGLVTRDQNNEYQPALATEWKQVDELTWEFKLRTGVTFHDGEPFNANAVKTTVDRLLDEKTGSPRASVFGMVQEVKVIDDSTVQFILKYPFAALLSILDSMEGSIISPKAINELGKDLAKKPVGTGPFQFESWTQGQDMVLTKNTNYWGKAANVEKIVYKVVPEDLSRIAMVQSGEAHIADQVPVTELERIQQSEEMTLMRQEGYGVEFVGFNVQKKPFDDVRVRQAIASAIELDSIIPGVYNNVGTKANSSMSNKVFGYNADQKGYTYDVNRAKELLKEAGYPDGFSTTIITDDRKERINLAEVLQSQLKGIGIDLQINTMEYGAYIDAISNGKQEMYIGGWGNATGDADYNQFNVFHSSAMGPVGNFSFYSNPEVDKLIEEGRREKDQEKRKAIYAKAQEIEMNDAPLIPIRTISHLAVTVKNMEGLWMNPVGYFFYNDVVLK